MASDLAVAPAGALRMGDPRRGGARRPARDVRRHFGCLLVGPRLRPLWTAGYGASVFYVFTTAVHTGILGAMFTLSTRPFYGLYAQRMPDAATDQRLAGLVMWIPAGFVLTVAGIGLFAAWLGESERRVRQSPASRGAA